MTRDRPRPDWATIPNLITVVRMVLIGPVCWLLYDGGPDPLSVILLLVWASTDWVDGLLARVLDQTSRTGAIIDPIADRLGLGAIVLTLALTGLLPWAALIVIFVVDLATTVLASRAALGGRIGVSALGKIRTFVLMAAVFLLATAAAWFPAALPAVQAFLWLGVLLHVITGVGYVRGALAAGAPPSPR
ncbi:MAG TPA: CDP-alcohol phosphatidyltransferase family protein [Candidatus Brachybacterium merdigallinarum]|nr:CDP-alcohol phosphatidyltransferase family protein [Candidatus Brachybacterium merdigallinarum]